MKRTTKIILLLCQAIQFALFVAILHDTFYWMNLAKERNSKAINIYVKKAHTNGAIGFYVSTNGTDWSFSDDIPYIGKRASDQLYYEHY